MESWPFSTVSCLKASLVLTAENFWGLSKGATFRTTGLISLQHFAVGDVCFPVWTLLSSGRTGLFESLYRALFSSNKSAICFWMRA